ncbi:MAG: hypothetical protein Fues2KO_04580 [Fuerstiella sp.]
MNNRILIIDDNRSIHADIRKILTVSEDARGILEDEAFLFGAGSRKPEISNFEIESAYQGEEGVLKAAAAEQRGKPYALAFVDMRMPPGLDGLQTIERLWKVDPCIEVVLCTAFSDYSWPELSRRLEQKSRLLILKKPFDNAEVAQLAACLTSKWAMSHKADARIDEMERTAADRARKIANSHREMESLLASISSLLVGLDDNGRVSRWNKSAEAVFEISASEAVGKRFDALPIAWDQPVLANQVFSARLPHENPRRTLNFCSSIGNRTIGVSSYPVIDEGKKRGTIILGTDITEQCRLQEQLQQAQKLEAVGQLAAGVAHEINTPMQYLGDNLEYIQRTVQKLKTTMGEINGIVTSGSGNNAALSQRDTQQICSLLANIQSPDQLLSAIEDSLEGVDHVSRIVRAMKEFAHPGNDEKTTVDINKCLRSTIAVSTNEWKYLATISTDFDETLPLVPAYMGELNQVFLNIIVNAAHAIEESQTSTKRAIGVIRISTQAMADEVEISISDTGNGIPDNIIHRIFDPFFTTKEVGKGTGQGLAIAHSVIVKKHHGSLRCHSEAGKGTTFTIRLPLNHRAPLTAAEPRTTQPVIQ